MTIQPDWIAVDWGTTRLRAWAMTGAGDALEARDSDRGMAALERTAFEPALLELIGDWLRPDRSVRVVACGMVGARQGWIEAPYRAVPGPALDAGGSVTAPTHDTRLDVRIVPGLMQADPPDVMRGEETQIAGLLAREPDFHGLLCLPGTHTKWVEVGDGQVQSFKTVMTGEIFALLAEQSVLRHSVGPESGKTGWDDAAFDNAVRSGLDHPEALTGALFALRARSLVADLAPDAARATLSGLLIGAELAGLDIGDGGDSDRAIIGTDRLAKLYRRALRQQGREARLIDGEDITLMGLRHAKGILSGSTS